MHNKTQWISRCAATYVEHGLVPEDVGYDMARSYADLLEATVGAAVLTWPEPEGAAKADIISWTED